jgi:hypothetical protein
MSGTELGAALVVILPSLGAALTWLLKASHEAGRADQYRSFTEQTISEKNKELLEQRSAISRLTEQLAECRGLLR